MNQIAATSDDHPALLELGSVCGSSPYDWHSVGVERHVRRIIAVNVECCSTYPKLKRRPTFWTAVGPLTLKQSLDKLNEFNLGHPAPPLFDRPLATLIS
jgi:hypothetical protein